MLPGRPCAASQRAQQLSRRAVSVVHQRRHQQDHRAEAQQRRQRDQRLVAVEEPSEPARSLLALQQQSAGQAAQRDARDGRDAGEHRDEYRALVVGRGVELHVVCSEVAAAPERRAHGVPKQHRPDDAGRAEQVEQVCDRHADGSHQHHAAAAEIVHRPAPALNGRYVKNLLII